MSDDGKLDPGINGRIEREMRDSTVRGKADGRKKQVEMVTTTDLGLALMLDEIPQVNVSKLLPNFPGNRAALVATLIYAREIGAEYWKCIPIVALFRGRTLQGSLRTAYWLQSIEWTLEELQPRFLEERDRYQIFQKDPNSCIEALLLAVEYRRRPLCNATESEGLRSLLGKAALAVKS